MLIAEIIFPFVLSIPFTPFKKFKRLNLCELQKPNNPFHAIDPYPMPIAIPKYFFFFCTIIRFIFHVFYELIGKRFFSS